VSKGHYPRGSGRVVTLDIPPASITGVRRITVQFDRRAIRLVQHIAVLVVIAAAELNLARRPRQPVRPLDIALIAPLQDRVQSSRIGSQQFAQFRTPANLGSQFQGLT
jgi:hypothetical protein